MSEIVVESVGPGLAPSPEALAAIVAALDVIVAKSVVATPKRRSNAWRFSGRTWSAPVPPVRDRLLRHHPR